MFGLFKKRNNAASKIKAVKPETQGRVQGEFEGIKHLFTENEINLVDPDDVWEVELNGEIYYHVTELEDGDFIGIDKNKTVYKITHDPFEIIALDTPLVQWLQQP